MAPLDLLVREHGLVLLGLDLLDRSASALDEGRDVPRAQLEQLLDFFHTFLDEHHHSKEEDDLFPAMIRAGFPAGGGPVAVMLGEHEHGRALARALRAALSVRDVRRFVAGATAFSALLRPHIAKENDVLYPMAERFVPSTVMAELGTRWAAGAEAESIWRDRLAGIDRAVRAAA